MESPKENYTPEFKSFTPKEGIVAPEHVQIIEEHLTQKTRSGLKTCATKLSL